jgi:hypothetical protein
MTTITAPLARTRRLVDVAVLTGRNLTRIAREPLRLSDVVIQPVVFTLLFVYILGSAVSGARSAARHGSPAVPAQFGDGASEHVLDQVPF